VCVCVCVCVCVREREAIRSNAAQFPTGAKGTFGGKEKFNKKILLTVGLYFLNEISCLQ
jgi:hypothetical protein